MSREKGKNNAIVIKELKAKIRILEKEKNTLAVLAKESQLFSLISNQLISKYDISSVIDFSLEQIANIKNLTVCCLCNLKDANVTVVSSYPKLSNGNIPNLKIQLGKKIKKEIAGCSKVYELGETKGIKIRYKEYEKDVPISYALLIPFKTHYLPNGIVIIADNEKSNRLSGFADFLYPILNMISDKIDKLFLLSEMQGIYNADGYEFELAACGEKISIENNISETGKDKERIETILNGTPFTFFYALDTKAKITYISPSVEKITGYSVQDWYNKPDWYVTGNKINDYAKERTRSHLQGEFTKGAFQLEIEHADKYPILLELFENPIIQNGKVVGLQGVAHDITERNRAEEAFKVSDEIFSQFMEHSPFYVFFKDSEMRSLRLSKNYESMLNKPLNELLYKSMDELFPSDLAKKMIADDQRILREGIQCDIEEEFNGRFYSTTKFPIYHNNEPRYLAGYTIDITDRKQAEQLLLSQNNYLKALNETTLDLISQLNINPLLENIVNRAGQLVGADSGFLSLVAPERTHLITKIQTGFFIPGNSAEIIYPGEGLAGKVWQSGQPMIIDDYCNWQGKLTTPYLTPAGSIMAVPLFSGNKIIGVLGISHEHTSNIFFNQDDLTKLNLFARFATIALENARLYTSSNAELADRKNTEKLLYDQNEYLKALQETSLDLISQLDLNLLLEKIVKRALQFIGTVSGFLAVPDEDGTKLVEKIKIGIFDTEKELVAISPGEGLVGRVWQSGKPMILDDYNSWSGRRKKAKLNNAGAIIALPLSSGDKIVGVLGLAYEKESSKFFDQEVLDKLNLFARFATIAIENAQLYYEANIELQERKRAEEALRKSEEKFRTMFNCSPIGIELYDNNGLLIAANKASLDMFGIPDFSDVQNFNMFDGTSLTDEIKIKLRRGDPVTYQAAFNFDKITSLKQYKTIKSGISYLDYSITPISGIENNSLLGYLLHVQDVTERKFAEKEINMLAQSLKCINECVSITDYNNNLLFVNKCFLDTYGYLEEELIGKNISVVGTSDISEELREEILQATLNGGWFGEMINKKKDGTLFSIALSTSVIKDRDGGILGLIGVAQDITDRKKTEEEIRTSNEELLILNRIIMESANQLDSGLLLQTALDEALQICGLEGGTVCIVTPDQRLHLAVERNSPDAAKSDLHKKSIKISECLCGNCVSDQKPIILNSHNEILEYNPGEVIRGEDLGFHAAFPILAKGICIGVLCVFTNTEKKPSPRSLKLIETMTSQIALTLENVNLYEQVQKQLVDLEEEISERKFYEENLIRNEKNLSITLNSIGDAVISTDEDGCVVRMNPVAEKLCGWKYEDAVGKSLSDVFKIINAQTRQPVLNPVKMVMETGKIIGMANHTLLLSRDGFEYQIADSAAPIKNEDGKIIGIVLVFSDVTEKYAIQESLKVSEATLVKAELFGKFGNWELSLSTMTITASKGALEIYGLKEGEYNLITVLNQVLPEYESSVYQSLEKIIKEKAPYDIEYKIHRKSDGKIVDIYSSAKINSEKGIVFGVIQDITERKLAEEQVRNSEKEYRNLFEHASDSILIFDPGKGSILEANSRACITYGFSKEELLNKNLMDISCNIENDMQFITDILNGAEIHNYEALHRKKDGTGINGLVSASVIEYKGRKAIQSFIVDITERKRAEQEIISQRNNFEQLFINSPIAIAIMDQYDKIIHINQSFTDLFGFTLEEASGNNLNELVVPNANKEEGVLLSKQAHIGRPISLESFRQKKDGTLVFVQIAGIPIEFDDRRIGIYAMYIDLTHRMRAEQETIKSKEIAEQSNKMKSEFLAQISHEIRSPINIITSNISLINEGMMSKIGPDEQDCFNSIYLATKRIIRTVDLILNMSELQTGSYKPILTAVDIDLKVLKMLYGEFQKPAKDKGIDLIYRNEIRTSQIIADEYSITQIFANLIDNAIKYTKKGSVEIILTKNKSDLITVEVKDTGIGINKDFLPRLFEPFIQEEQGYTRSYEGNGLGLSLVRKYCEINNAAIEFESEKNVGSVFRIIFTDRRKAN